MDVFYAFTIEDYNSRTEIINRIRRFLLSQGHNLTMDWVNVVENNMAKYTKFQMKRLFKNSIKHIEESKVIILESTTPSFEITTLAHKAIQLKKPVLLLSRKPEEFEAPDEDFITITDPDYLDKFEYTDENYEHIITEFIKKNQNDPISRFNILLERKQKNYLDWADRFYRMNKSEFIRELINEKAKNDINYPQNR